MIEERFESYVYQIMKYVKYQENKPYIESILEDMKYTLFREYSEYIKELEQKIDKAIDNLFELKDMIYEPKTREINFDVQRKISETIKILGDKENEKE